MRIIIGYGGFYLSYFMGFFHYIFEKYGKKVFREVEFEGISAGAHTAAYSISTVFDVYNINI